MSFRARIKMFRQSTVGLIFPFFQRTNVLCAIRASRQSWAIETPWRLARSETSLSIWSVLTSFKPWSPVLKIMRAKSLQFNFFARSPSDALQRFTEVTCNPA